MRRGYTLFDDAFSAAKSKLSGKPNYGTLQLSGEENERLRSTLLQRVKDRLTKQLTKSMERLSTENQARVIDKKEILSFCITVLHGQKTDADLQRDMDKRKKQNLNYTQADGWFYRTSDTTGLVDEVLAFAKTHKTESLSTSLLGAQSQGSLHL
ncbi:MAG: hypothetical protein A3I77_06485 [Gammaproteobacteria bacterium RIFCSPLOWO2_02_FULL_42_14]|nr:MAG: hypothetical protein A3B71_06355 [Gammaproteobacteria bacterium RIFCSPHIGHO2_02_FULL_42_43]OGT29085.1 MAG: hypothetical protein A2624_05205 [Gammaproteobacteria bacterium RIFCSPHIGHO2_01_FULL_42_8]OGT52746.1 MAG: hypothetical protein A3E54_02535 [Gammaproteobacteria bacterium RIFCSPHIGHO2_12_FULL_41_25]OGT63292.1 MAG: hypothetical protein A3I77_06485 [Gammaproteobacteria bacterium RIFCSPLOWO2_02_FULL_42_14]OGT86880.1 MAG: hypothetical protein A3G86_05745 [Gammaproteobacteria bacterium R